MRKTSGDNDGDNNDDDADAQLESGNKNINHSPFSKQKSLYTCLHQVIPNHTYTCLKPLNVV